MQDYHLVKEGATKTKREMWGELTKQNTINKECERTVEEKECKKTVKKIKQKYASLFALPFRRGMRNN